jgi:hypothetical protein
MDQDVQTLVRQIVNDQSLAEQLRAELLAAEKAGKYSNEHLRFLDSLGKASGLKIVQDDFRHFVAIRPPDCPQGSKSTVPVKYVAVITALDGGGSG